MHAVGDSVRDCPCFAGSSSCDDRNWTVHTLGNGALLLIEALKHGARIHQPIVACPCDARSATFYRWTMTSPDSEGPIHIIMYSTVWCGYCQRLKSHMIREGVPFTEVDISEDEAAAEFVESVNAGNQTVPTLRFSDGTTMTNPPFREVEAKLASLRS
jgi:mycoredoxin